MNALAAFQQAFAQALWQADAEPPAVAGQAAFAVYRNTVTKACVDALQANHPSVLRLVGEAWFRPLAVLYARNHPPRQPCLLHYGTEPDSGLAHFLAGFEPAAAWPYLAGVALLDGAWAACHTAADAGAADPAALAALTPQALGRLRLLPHPAARWHWFDGLPVCSIWAASRAGTAVPDPLPWCGEGALLTRPLDHVQWCAIGRAGCAWLDACAAGALLGEAAEAALAAEPGCDLSAVLALLLGQGALVRPDHQGNRP